MQVVAGFVNAYARLSDGSLWSWGSNSYGMLANGSSVSSKKIPVAVPMPSGREVARLGSGSIYAETVFVVTKAG